MYLIDTNVISELRKRNFGTCHPNVAAWADSIVAESIFIADVSIYELELGVLQMERRDPKQGNALRSWLNTYVLGAFGGRIIAHDTTTWLRAAKLNVPDRHPLHDSLIAAAALAHNLIMVTRNIKDFQHAGLAVIDPWQPPPYLV